MVTFVKYRFNAGYFWLFVDDDAADSRHFKYPIYLSQCSKSDAENQYTSGIKARRGLHVNNPFLATHPLAIEVKKLSFGYDGGRNVLKKISLSISKGAKGA